MNIEAIAKKNKKDKNIFTISEFCKATNIKRSTMGNYIKSKFIILYKDYYPVKNNFYKLNKKKYPNTPKFFFQKINLINMNSDDIKIMFINIEKSKKDNYKKASLMKKEIYLQEKSKSNEIKVKNKKIVKSKTRVEKYYLSWCKLRGVNISIKDRTIDGYSYTIVDNRFYVNDKDFIREIYNKRK